MAGVRFNTIKFIGNHFKGFRMTVVIVLVNFLIVILPLVSYPILYQVFVDNIISGVNPDWASAFFVFYFLVTMMEIAVRVIEASNWKYQLRMTINATTELLWHTLHLPLNFFHDNFAGDIASKVSYPSGVADHILRKMMQTVAELMFVIIYMLFMIRYSLFLSLFGILHIVLTIHIMKRVNRRRVELNKKMQMETSKLQGFTSASINNIEAIKGAGAEYGFFERWSSHFTASQNAALRCSRQNVFLSAVPLLLKAVADAFVMGIGIYYIMEGQMSIGMLLAFQGFMAGCMGSMTRLSDRFQIWAGIKAKCEIMDRIYSEPNEISEELDDNTPYTDGKLKGYVELKNVTFGYDRNAEPLISNFNLSLEPGKSVAFVGQSGCGKSTLAKLISGLYRPWDGNVLFDGKRMDEINKKVFNNSVAIVDQNIVLFDGTISDNVKLWDKSIEDFVMLYACNDAQIHNEIASRSNAYESRVENGGKNFSGGQRQRLEIATALVKEPTVIVMDEGTSALDAVTEERVMKAIKDMGISLIMIAHRLSTIRDCDEIIVLDKGKVVERGTHSELMNNRKLYSQLVGNI